MTERNSAYISEIEQGLATGETAKGEPFDHKTIDIKKIPDEYDKVRLALIAYWTGRMSREEARLFFLEDPDMVEGYAKLVTYYEKSRTKQTEKITRIE